jgi:hypothetical protein
MIREKEKNNKEGRLWRLKKFEEESYREAVSYTKRISQDFSDCGLHNDKYTKNQPCKNCGLRALVETFRTHQNYCIFHLSV